MTWTKQQTMALTLGAAIFFVVLDRLAKLLALRLFSQQPLALTSYFKFDFFLNRRLAFSLPLAPWLATVLTALLVAALLVWTLTLIKKRRLTEAGFTAAVWLAASSNLFDRLFYGGVIDYLNLKYFTVFNLDDAVICLGLAALAIKNLKRRGER